MQIKVIGEHDDNTISQLKNCVEFGGVKGVLCADGHVGYAQPVGGVVAYRDAISISGVGYDIACGNMAVKLPIHHGEIKDWKEIGRKIQNTISFGIGRSNENRVEADFLDTDANWDHDLIRDLKDLAADQLGTVGSGNHYVDVFRDNEGFVWIGVHFGSRGFGHKTTTRHLEAAGGKDGMFVAPTVVELKSDVGRSYQHGMELAGQYAYAGRQWVCETVAQIITGNVEFIDQVHNHHNFAFKETHDGEELYVVRKGATPAFPGQRGFVGGSMGDISVILHGLDTAEAKDNLYSTVHGAGRLLSRTQAAGKFKGWGKNRKQTAPGLIDPDVMRKEVAEYGVHLFGAGADEAPACYRKLNTVLDYHKDSIAVEKVLYPIVVVMARPDTYDPYKD